VNTGLYYYDDFYTFQRIMDDLFVEVDNDDKSVNKTYTKRDIEDFKRNGYNVNII